MTSQQPDEAALTPGARTPPLAGYVSDANDGPDALDIEWEVEALAGLIAARSIDPPMSIGLFGDWGSGKSFFMRLLQRRVDRLAAGATSVESVFCSRVVQINFNAWHYIEADLWASLITRIFEGLFDGLSKLGLEPNVARRAILQELASTKELIRQAQIKQKAFEDEAEKADRQLEEIQRAGITSAQPSGAPADEVERVATVLGVPADASISKMDEAASGIWHDVGKLRRGWASLGENARKRVVRRGALTVGAAVGVAVVAFWLLRSVPAIFTVGLPVLAAILAYAYQAINAISELVRPLIDSEKQRAINDLKVRAQRAHQSAERFRLQSAEQTKELERIEARSAEGPYDFIKEQYTGDKYRKQLGIVALIQRDMERLSELLHPKSREPGKQPAEIPEIERIVLYIDDLDRCSPDRVIEVLQAIHLLLAFRLFVVVVAVDSRWLLSSLKREYDRQLSTDEVESRTEWRTTPQDYLEKIFQIPFWIRPMRQETFKKLLWSAIADTTASSTNSERVIPDIAATGDLARSVVQIDPVEIDMMAKLRPFVRTPRAAKRLVNTYRLIRTIVRSRDIGRSESAPDFEAIVLLGLVTGYPEEAGEIFAELGAYKDKSWWSFVDELTPQPADQPGRYRNLIHPSMNRQTAERWQQLVAGLSSFRNDLQLDSIQVFKDWAPEIARFSFRAGRIASELRLRESTPAL